MSVKGKAELTKVQRKAAIRVASAYSTISTESSHVLADLPPIDLLVTERRNIYMGKWTNDAINNRVNARETLMKDWQSRWDSSKKGRWTYQLVKNIETWHERNHGEMSFHLTQVFTGHSCFASYLHKIGKTPSPSCWYCDNPTGDAFHTVFECDAWHHRRRRLHYKVGEDINPDSILSIMMKSKENWAAVREFIQDIMRKKEDGERRK